ncbi:MAG: sensor histidine kinase [Ferruginibacter sp.]|nr:sensor histidine kinase [Ferruginibacter sp.]
MNNNRANQYYTAILLIVLLLTGLSAPSQKRTIDSLKKVLNSQENDTARLAVLNKICTRFFENSDWDSIAGYAKAEFELATKLNSKPYIANAYKSLGYNDYALNNFESAFTNFSTSLKMMQELNNKEGIAISSLLLGKINYQLGNYTSALKNARAALSLINNSNDLKMLAGCYYDIGLYCEVLHDYPQSLQNYYKALGLYKKAGPGYYGKDKYYFIIARTFSSIGNIYILTDDNENAVNSLKLAMEATYNSAKKNGLGYISNLLGEVYLKQGHFNMALQKQTEAIELWNKYADLNYQSWAIPYTHRNIGNIYKKQGEVALSSGNKDSARFFFEKSLLSYSISLKGYTDATDKSGLPEAYTNIGKVYLLLKNATQASHYINTGLKLSVRDNNMENLKESYYCLSQLDSMQANFKSAYQNYKMYIVYRDSLVNEEGIRKSENYKLQYEFEKKDDEIKLLSTENKLQSVLTQQQRQRKNIAFISVAILILITAYGFFRYNKRRKEQNYQAMNNERLRISSELHDEVGAALSGISMYSHLTKEQMKHAKTAEVEKSLNIMQQSAGEMVNKLNDIVWLINPGQDTLQKLIQRLEEYAGEMAAIKNMQVIINLPPMFSEHSLQVESRRNIYLFCKEAINNAVKYSEASLLELTIKENNCLLEIIISDNGKGFDIDTIKRGNGLNNMQKRADELGADFDMQSKPGEGCKISLIIEITR